MKFLKCLRSQFFSVIALSLAVSVGSAQAECVPQDLDYASSNPKEVICINLHCDGEYVLWGGSTSPFSFASEYMPAGDHGGDALLHRFPGGQRLVVDYIKTETGTYNVGLELNSKNEKGALTRLSLNYRDVKINQPFKTDFLLQLGERDNGEVRSSDGTSQTILTHTLNTCTLQITSAP